MKTGLFRATGFGSILALVLASLVVMSACASPTPSPTSTPTATPTPSPTLPAPSFGTPGPKTLVAIAIQPATPNPLGAGQFQQFKAVATYFDGSTADITNQVAWGSSDTNVAVITPDGTATALGNGTTIIVACLDLVCNAVTLTCTSG